MAMQIGFPAQGEVTLLCCSIGQEVSEKRHAQSAHGITLLFWRVTRWRFGRWQLAKNCEDRDITSESGEPLIRAGGRPSKMKMKPMAIKFTHKVSNPLLIQHFQVDYFTNLMFPPSFSLTTRILNKGLSFEDTKKNMQGEIPTHYKPHSNMSNINNNRSFCIGRNKIRLLICSAVGQC